MLAENVKAAKIQTPLMKEAQTLHPKTAYFVGFLKLFKNRSAYKATRRND